MSFLVQLVITIFALNYKIKEVRSWIFFFILEKIFYFFRNLEDIEENTGQEKFFASEEGVFI